MRYAEKLRLDWIARRVAGIGQVSRADLMREFGISRAQASKDMRKFHRANPDLLRYDARLRAYVRDGQDKPVVESEP